MSQDLSIPQGRVVEQQTLSASELADNILIAFKRSVKDAGSFKENEYQALYSKAEGQLKMYLGHMVALVEHAQRP